MAAFTDAQRAQIRLYMGMPRIFQNSNPILESSLTAIENLTDTGATQAAMVSALTSIASVETKIANLLDVLIAVEVTGEVRVDAARAIAVLKQEGSRLINQLAFPLSMAPAQSYFYAVEVAQWRS